MTKPSARSSTVSLPVVAGELAAGLLCGVAAAALFGSGGGYLLGMLVPDIGMGLLAIMLYLGVLGFAVGAGLGVWLAGRWQQQGGSWWLSMGGGAFGGFVVLALARTGLFGTSSGAALTLAAAASLGLAVLGYNLRRQTSLVAR